MRKKSEILTRTLGNIRVTVSDKKFNTALTIAATSATSYLPFGMVEPNMFVSASGHRYGHGSHEKDNEISGEGNHLDFGGYGMDPRSARRWNIEPMISKVPNLSSYAILNNNPNKFKDPNGKFFIIDHVALDWKAYTIVYGHDPGVAKTAEMARFSFNREIPDADKPTLHLDNMNHDQMVKALNSGAYQTWDNHQLQDFYSHSNYVDLLYDYTFYTKDQKIPLLDELEKANPRAYEFVMNNIRTTNYKVKDNDPYEHTNSKKNQRKGPLDNDIAPFSAKDDKEHPLYNQALDAALRATVKKMQEEKDFLETSKLMKEVEKELFQNDNDTKK